MDSPSRIARLSRAGSRVSRGMSLSIGLLQRNLWAWPLLAAAGVAIAGLWIRHSVENSARNEMREGLQAILSSNVEALKIWLETEKEHVTAAATDVDVRRAGGELIKLAADESLDPSTLSQSDLQVELRAALRPVLAGKRYSGYALLDVDHRIVASDRPELIGLTRNTSYDIVGRALEQGALVTQPFPSVVLMRDVSGELRAGQPTMFAAAPLRNLTGDVVGVLGLRIKPDQDFARILQIARPGETGETYAFDKDGLLLSESRFTAELVRLGLVPDQPGVNSQLNVSIRDPGIDLTTGKRPAKPRAEQPLTLMAASAIQSSGDATIKTNVEGYRDYRGVPVVGAWTWLNDYQFGVATEMDVAEAYDSLYILRTAFWSLFGLLVVSSVLICAFSIAMSRLQKVAQTAAIAAKKLGQYQLDEKLGEGGMGVVYRGCHTMLRRATAIKLLHPEKTTDEAIARFEREVQLTCQLNHPNTIAIFDYGRTPEGLFFYAMEYLDGLNLDALVSRFGPQPEGRVIHILTQICGSLAEAHEIGLVHRDIKPANIILNRRGGQSDVVKVLDFGLVKAIDARKEANLTNANAVLGTPLYMSPEAIEAADTVDGRSDLYAVAAVGYFLLTGQPPFDGKSVMEICLHQISTPPTPPSERLGKQISPDLEAVLLRGLAKKPADRFATAGDLAEALRGCRSAQSWPQSAAFAWWQAYSSGQPVIGGSTDRVDQARTLEMTAEMPG